MYTQSFSQSFSYLSNFKVAKFIAVYEVGAKGLELPLYKGSTFRGSFGHVFREVACTCPTNMHGEVDKHLDYCVYAYIFETFASEDGEVSQNQEIERPFLLEPPIDSRNYYSPGERLTLGFTLFGKGVEYLPYFIYVLDGMGKKGLGKKKRQAELRQVFSVNEKGDWIAPIYNASDRLIKNDYSIITGQKILAQHDHFDVDKVQLQIHFITPTRLKYQGEYTDQPEFHILLRSALRRISSLLYFHHNQLKLEMDYGAIFKSAEKNVRMIQSKVVWQDWERYSNRQKQRLKMGGIVGSAIYEGDLQEYLPWLQIAEWIHIGKNPVFGLGQIKMIYK